MALTETRTETEVEQSAPTETPRTTALERLVGTGDHTTIGRLFIGFALMFAAVAAVTKALVALDIVTDNGFLGGRTSMLNASALVAFVLMAVVPLLLGLAICVVPLQLGSPAIAFPRAASLALWTWLLSAGIFITSICIDGGVLGADRGAARLGNVSMGAMMAALVLGSVCVATTVMAQRPMGMRLARVPLFSWSMLVATTVWIATLASTFAHVIVGQVGHMNVTELAVNFAEGMAWMVRAPSIYMLAIPVLGIAGDVAASATGHRLKNYGVFQGAIAAYGVLAFGAWSQLPRSIVTPVWTIAALAVALPVLITFGGLAESLRRGKLRISPALAMSLVAVLLILGSVVAGLVIALDNAGVGELWGLNAAALFESQAYFLFGASLAGALAGCFHWSAKLWGGPASTAVSGLVGLLVVGGGAIVGTALLAQGIVQVGAGDTTAYQLFGVLEAAGVVLIALGMLGALQATLGASRVAARDHGSDATEDSDQRGLTLEWSAPSPAVGGLTPVLPTVTSPYPLLDAREGDGGDGSSSTKESS